MILNAYAVLDAFIALLRLGVGLAALGLWVGAWLYWRQRQAAIGEATALEDRCYLLYLLAGLLVWLNVLSWPLDYLLLQSYVTAWPGVMCIYGVTRIGLGSLGPSRFLPALVTTLQVTKPALVFLSGAWFVLYLANRRSRTAPLTGRVLLVLLAVAVLTIADAAVEVAYLCIPKKEEFLSVGCCTALFDADSRASRFLPAALFGENDLGWLVTAYCIVNAGMALALASSARPARRAPAAGVLAMLLVGAVVSLVVNIVFLLEVAAPRLNRLPGHHCPYDLVERAPESLLAIALFLVGLFSVGWAAVLAWLGRSPETSPFLPRMLRGLFRLGTCGYAWSLLMMLVEVALP